MPDVVAYPIVFNMLCDRDQKGGLLILMKNNQILEFLAVWVLFTLELHENISVLYVLECLICFYFVF